jgi:adenylosuccinate synthase
LKQLGQCEPVYETFPGWMAPTGEARHLSDLPENARRYIERLEEVSQVPVSVISVSPSRESFVCLDDSLLNYEVSR